jgi:flagellin-like protein
MVKILMQKAISPLVATVLLIAITMTLAGIVAFWGSSFVRTSLPTENQTGAIQACTAASIRLVTSSYNSTNNALSITIYNDGTQRLMLTNITFIYPDRSETKEINEEISPGQVIVKLIDNVANGYTSFLISTNCPNVYIKYP